MFVLNRKKDHFMSKKLLVLVMLTAPGLAWAALNGNFHPNYLVTGVDAVSEQNVVRVVRSQNQLQAYRTTGAMPAAYADTRQVGADGLLPLFKDSLSRVELWQRYAGDWWLTQFLVLNQQGNLVGDTHIKGADTANPNRTRVDAGYVAYSNFDTSPITVQKEGTDESITLNNYPISMEFANFAGNLAAIDNLRTPGTGATSQGVFAPDGGTPPTMTLPYNWKFTSASAPVGVNSMTLKVNGDTISSAQIQVYPLAQFNVETGGEEGGDAGDTINFNGAVSELPPVRVDAVDLYPQTHLVFSLDTPDGARHLLLDCGILGSVSSTETIARGAELNIREYVMGAGDYVIRAWIKTPLAGVAGVTNIQGLNITDSLTGVWENPWSKTIHIEAIKVSVEGASITTGTRASNP